MNDIPDGMVATERFQNYENNLKNGAELLRDRKLPTNNKTYGQLITDDELKALALVEFPEIKSEYFSLYDRDKYPDLESQIDDRAKRIMQQRIKPYNNNPYEFNMQRDQPEEYKRFELYNSPEAQNIRAMEKENIFLPYNPLEQKQIDMRIKPDKAFRTKRAEEIATWGVNPTDVIDFEGSEKFQKNLGFLPRNVTVDDLDYYSKALGINGDFKYIDPEKPELGIKFKNEGEDTYKIINSPFIDRQDIIAFGKKEGPAIAADIGLTVAGTKGFDKVLKGSKFKTLKTGSQAWAREMAYLDPAVLGRLKDIGVMSFLSATGAAGGDFVRMSVGKGLGYVDRDFSELLSESAMIGALSFAGTAAITSAIKFIPSVWKRFTGQEVPPSFYQQMDDLYEQAAREEAGLGTARGGKQGEIAYGREAGTNQEIRDGIAEMTELMGEEIGKWQPTLSGSTGNIDANTIENIFLRNADPEGKSWIVYKGIKENNRGVINRFLKSINDYYAEGITGDATGLTVGQGLRGAARSEIENIEKSIKEAIENLQTSWRNTQDELTDSSTLVFDDVVNPGASGSQIFTRYQTKLEDIRKNYSAAASENWTAVKSDPRYSELFTGAGFTRKPATDWKRINNKKAKNIFNFKDRSDAADEFFKGIPEGLRNRLQGRNASGTRLGGADEINFSLQELDMVRVGLNDMASKTNNDVLRASGRELEHGIEKQMQKMVDDKGIELYKQQTGKTPNALELEKWKQENNWGVDLAEAWQAQGRAMKESNAQIFKTIQASDSPESVIDYILTTNVKNQPNRQIDNFVKVIKSQGDGNELPQLQKQFGDWIKNNILENPDLSASKKATAYSKFMRENRGTIKALYGEEPSQVFGYNAKQFKKFQIQMDEYDAITNTLRNKFAPNNPAASPYNFIDNILNASKSQKESGLILFDIEQMMKLAKGNELLEEQIKTATIRWITQNVVVPEAGRASAERIVNYDALVKVISDGFGPEDMVGKQLTFESFIKPLLGKDGDAYMVQFKRWANLVTKEAEGPTDQRATSQALEATQGIWEYVRKTWIKPLTQFGRRTTAFTKRMGENQREVMAEMMLDPKALKRQLDWAQGKIRKDAYIRFLTSWGSVASMDLANELKYYDREDKIQRSPEKKLDDIADTYYDSVTSIPTRILNIENGAR